jgi:transketolase
MHRTDWQAKPGPVPHAPGGRSVALWFSLTALVDTRAEFVTPSCGRCNGSKRIVVSSVLLRGQTHKCQRTESRESEIVTRSILDLPSSVRRPSPRRIPYLGRSTPYDILSVVNRLNEASSHSLDSETNRLKTIRRLILTQSKRANVGHIGSCLCVVEILAALYGGVMRKTAPNDPDRDRFILSKGHAALALYAVLVLQGHIAEGDLNTFCGDDSIFGVHPESLVPGIDFSTGSLGHGLSIAAGAALAARMQESQRRVYCLISDAECNEGSVWEAAMFGAHHQLNNLHVIVDVNGQQALGRTFDVLDASNLAERWASFGWRVSLADGHSIPELVNALSADSPSPAPHVILAKTAFGRGVSYMEQGRPITQSHLPVQPINWHYLPMSDQEYEIALAELGASG